jgi:hypothetical protein
MGGTALAVVKSFAVKSAKDKASARKDALAKLDNDVSVLVAFVKASGGVKTAKNETISTTDGSQKAVRFVTRLASEQYSKADVESIATESGSLILGDSGAYSALFANRFAVAMGWLEKSESQKVVEQVAVNPKGKAVTALRAQTLQAVGAKPKPPKAVKPIKAEALSHWLGLLPKTAPAMSRQQFLDFVREHTKPAV